MSVHHGRKSGQHIYITLEDMSAFLPQLKYSEFGRESLMIETVYSRETCGYTVPHIYLREMLMKGRTNSSNPCVV